MLEIVNQLKSKQFSELDNFLTFLGIYEDARRTASFKKALIQNKELIKNKVCVEAGAGLGEIAQIILDLGAKKLFCVEENPYCCRQLKKRFAAEPRAIVINKRIEEFRPKEAIDFLFQELYGPLLLDENLLALEKLRFRPKIVFPNQGYLLMEAVKLEGLKDETIDKKILASLKAVLITDLFPNFKFRNPGRILKWEFSKKTKKLKIKPPACGEILAFGMEIWHDAERICGTQDCRNWPYVFTPNQPSSFELSFKTRNFYTETKFKWLG